jgi:hypothetical protein
MTEDAIEGLSEAELLALSCVLDTMIPPSADGRLPGAGELGLAAGLGETIAAQPALKVAVGSGLAAFRDAIEPGGLDAFAARPIAERSRVLSELEEGQPAFIPALTFATYTAYYKHPRVIEALGIEAWPPHPKGYEMEPTDPSLLERVRRKPPLYREC